MQSALRRPRFASGACRAPVRVSKPARAPVLVVRASSEADSSLEGYTQVTVDSVRVAGNTAIVYLRISETGHLLPVHIGEAESNALIQQMNRQKPSRPMTHDAAKNMLLAVGFRVTKVRITSLVHNTYLARIHLGPGAPSSSSSSAAAAAAAAAAAGSAAPLDEVDVDARPSDAINLAFRFGAPMYVARALAETAASPPHELGLGSAGGAAGASGGLPAAAALGGGAAAAGGESNAEVVRSVRELLASYDDPTIHYQLQKELAIKEERFEDARVLHDSIVREMTNNRLLRMVVAMESALADGRYEEAAKLRDEYKKAVTETALAASQQGLGYGGDTR
ncbi:hypothetical protein Rsub_06353 [Raphidocelis subcapitata]|uniref:BFN domain-containing protein n=1 Tax=Raphidocelis subcapitata TaxID=307507 RepID=A0A2V0P172_9CHLO|nr:hypothetical protein Rsub_06353 [Raphidocelis subcapitata]|eukprot:GBF93631.1 hypothetical protein Rsub_06353 [Raphidocelis subcapitata]